VCVCVFFNSVRSMRNKRTMMTVIKVIILPHFQTVDVGILSKKVIIITIFNGALTGNDSGLSSLYITRTVSEILAHFISDYELDL